MNDNKTEYAFPFDAIGNSQGMTLRDWFAGLALNGITINDREDSDFYASLANIAFKISDAMMKERGK